ncbi:MAG: IS21 family transposase, partial [Armatimonadetes bacterium]|nr:IS21 family transposase [Armatimonadota bacterium]
REAIALGAISFDVIFNLLSRQTEAPPLPPAEHLPEHLRIRRLPLADCGRYDRLLEGGSHAS